MATDPKFTTARYPRPVLLDHEPTCAYCGHWVSHHDNQVPECTRCVCNRVVFDDGLSDCAEVDF